LKKDWLKKDHTMKKIKFLNFLLNVTLFFVFFSCATAQRDEIEIGPALDLPFIKNTPEECYYLDEFMPAPDSMVPGKTGALSLRYYTYKLANYKDWAKKQVILSFYSADDMCWSLFEEYYIH
ncbi:hypothetical protein MEO40_26305, partial [Dolichospermum sp. ST_sed1]|nr:hypothetical protein [Dolichospermum sp. ST_sed1]